MENIIIVMPKLLSGALTTLEVTAVALFFGVLIGLVMSLMKMSNHVLPRFIACGYIEIIRGTPVLVQMLLFYFGIPPIVREVLRIAFDYQGKFLIEPLMACMIVCSLNSGAYVAEIFRAGVQSIDKGQMEAARSLGMTQNTAMKKVILPQAIKVVLPPLGNEFVVLVKETSIASVIGVTELTKAGQLHIANTFTAFSTYVGVAIVYFVMTFTLSRLVGILERRLAQSDRS